MRITHVTSLVSSRADGVRAAIEQLSASQGNAGHDVNVFGLAARADRTEASRRWMGAPLDIVSHTGPLGLGYAPMLQGRLRTRNPDIIHAHGLWMYPPSAAARRRIEVGTPLILSPHGMLNSFALSLSRWKKRIASLLYQERVFRAASLIHVTCDKELQEVRDYGLTQPVAVIPNGVSLPRLENTRPKSRTILALGRIHPIKGLDRLVAAWAEVEKHAPGWALRIIGPDNGGYSDQLREQAKGLGLERMTIEEALFGAEKHAVLSDSALFILPSLTENFAMTVAEALAAGTPVIVSTAAPWQDVVDHGCGWWIEPEKDRLVAAMLQAIALPEGELRKMGEKGRDWMRADFSWSSIADRFGTSCEWLLGRAARPSWIVPASS